MNLFRIAFAGCVLAGAGTLAEAKPIAFSHGTTVMAEYGAGTMTEAQVFYAPKYFLSLGGGHLELESDIDHRRREITYARANYLVKRWNLEDAQANVFVWGGAGQAYVSELDEHQFAANAGAQIDYETRRIYASLKTDLQRADAFSHRTDTLQLGLAPYKHDFDSLATWFVLQGRQYTGGIHDGTEWALLLRLFKRGAWIEAGVTDEGKLQAMAMVNF
ncbi:MAG TPA: hypothetical protein VJP84_17295 [Steroidobacteraceae bacterium]|jgi:hypothetical protein|nr:hypothetical protein [Steroidobacteraceae bacterium]